MIRAGVIYPLDEVFNPAQAGRILDARDWFPAIAQAVVHKGHWWALGMHAGGTAFYYNPALFEAAGIPPDAPPQTWQEVDAYGKKLTQDSNGDGNVDSWGAGHATFTRGSSLAWRWTPYLWQAGGRLFDDQGHVEFAADAGTRAVQFIVDAIKSGYNDPARDAQNVFISKRMGMLYSATGLYGRIADWAKTAEMPKDVARAANLGGHSLVVTSVEHRAEVATFLAWLMQPENHAYYSINGGNPLPVTRSEAATPTYQQFLAGRPNLVPLVRQMEYIRYSPYPEDISKARALEVLGDSLLKAYTGELSPKAALLQAKTGVEALRGQD